ncbi:MAG: putative competence-and mitomycin-induced protein, partial [Actinomyces urogenitalis DORA_12]
AGPGAADGHEAGTVHVAVVTSQGSLSRELHLEGDRDAVRDGATTAVLALAVGVLDVT